MYDDGVGRSSTEVCKWLTTEDEAGHRERGREESGDEEMRDEDERAGVSKAAMAKEG